MRKRSRDSQTRPPSSQSENEHDGDNCNDEEEKRTVSNDLQRPNPKKYPSSTPNTLRVPLSSPKSEAKARLETFTFNSKSFKNGYQGLSNLVGGAEFDYMGARFPQQAMKDLFESLKNCDTKTFLEWLRILQPGKKWTPAKLKYWFTPDGEPIRGILAQLLGSMVRRKSGKFTPASKRRQKVVCEKLGLAAIEIAPELPGGEKRRFMKECLRKKYSLEPYRSLLLDTGSGELHEKPIRGHGNNWTLPGGDWLGQLLMEVRAEIGRGGSKKRPAEAIEAAPAKKQKAIHSNIS